MANDRYDSRRERGGYSDHDRERGRYQERGRDEDRGFFARAGDELASWFGDDEAEPRRREDERMNRGWGEGDHDRDRSSTTRSYRRDFDRGRFEQEGRGSRPTSDRDYRSSNSGHERDFGSRGYGAAASGRGYGSSGFGGSEHEQRDFDRGGHGRSERPYGRDDYSRTSSAGSRDTDRSYMAWRQRQLDELDRDYDEYRRENQERFESDFGTWRQTRQQKRGLMGRIREHMDVVGSDGEEIGKVDCVKGDRVILTKSDSDDNRHHSIKCTMIDTVEGDQVRLDIPAEEAKSRWKDEDERGFFRGEEEGQDVNLERSFAGTYR